MVYHWPRPNTHTTHNTSLKAYIQPIHSQNTLTSHLLTPIWFHISIETSKIVVRVERSRNRAVRAASDQNKPMGFVHSGQGALHKMWEHHWMHIDGPRRELWVRTGEHTGDHVSPVTMSSDSHGRGWTHDVFISGFIPISMREKGKAWIVSVLGGNE